MKRMVKDLVNAMDKVNQILETISAKTGVKTSTVAAGLALGAYDAYKLAQYDNIVDAGAVSSFPMDA